VYGHVRGKARYRFYKELDKDNDTWKVGQKKYCH